jgi:hypothetical protein
VPSPSVSAGQDTANPAAAVPEKGTGITGFIESARVAGVRAAGDDSRVLMNDHVYRVNDVVSAELGLRLTRVDADKLTFVDGDGATYIKNF